MAPSASVTAADIEATVPLAGGGSILIIDDEEANRALLSSTDSPGDSVLVAATGEAGLAIAARESVDVILLDVWLPGTSGDQILARLKSNEASREIPVLVITAVDRAESVARCLALGADDYLPKPFDPVVLGAPRSQLPGEEAGPRLRSRISAGRRQGHRGGARRRVWHLRRGESRPGCSTARRPW